MIRATGKGWRWRRGVLPLLAALAWLALATAAFAGEWQETKATPEEIYAKYGGREDEISLVRAERLLLRLINRDREDAGLTQLSADPVAARAAREHALEMAKHRYLSHFDLAGQKPTWRYNAAGGTDQVAENLSYWESDVQMFLTPQLVEDIETRWMNSEEHRRNILAPAHTSVGVAIVLLWDGERSVVTAAQEFVDDYGDFSPLPAEASSTDELMLAGTLEDDVSIVLVGIGYEELPSPQKPENLNAELNGYSLPQPFVGILPKEERFRRSFSEMPTLYLLQYEPARHRFQLRLKMNDVFEGIAESHFPASRPRGFTPGLYYFMVYAESADAELRIISAQVVEIRR